MEKFDAFKPKKTSEALAGAITESKIETAAADKEAVEKVLIRRIGFHGKTERQMSAEDRTLNLDAVYNKFREDIISEAEYITAAYNEYAEKLKVVAAAQGIEVTPVSIDTFVKDVERHEESIQKNAEKPEEGGLGAEYSFYSAGELGRDGGIKRQVESDIAAVVVPAGTQIGFGPRATPVVTKKDFYRTRPGMARDAAMAEAQAKGAEYLMRSEIHFTQGEGTLTYNKTPRHEYTVVSKEYADLMRGSDGVVRGPFIFRDNTNYHDEIYDSKGTGYIHTSPRVELIKVPDMEKERAPVTVTLNVKGMEYPISESNVKEAMSAIGGKIHSNTWGGNLLEVVKGVSVTLPDGKQVGLMELTPDMLESARVMLPEGEEKKAA